MGCFWEPDPVGVAEHIEDMRDFVLPGEQDRFNELYSEVAEAEVENFYVSIGLNYYAAEPEEDEMVQAKIAYDRMLSERVAEPSAADQALLDETVLETVAS